jgi:signal transduction histidine kinase/HAMP domain-containing protein
MSFNLRLKTKLVIAISGMVVALVVTLLTIYVSQLVHQAVSDAYETGAFVAREIEHSAREAIESDWGSARIKPVTPEEVRDFTQESLQTDPGLNSLMESIVGYNLEIYDAAIVGLNGTALMHSNPNQIGKVQPKRDDFGQLQRGGFRDQLKIVYGPQRLYEITLPVQRNDRPYVFIKVYISTVLLKNTLRPQLNRALFFSAISSLISLLLAAGLSNLTLSPLEAISRRLDQMSAGDMTPAPAQIERTDEYGAVSTKIERIGRQMRSVNEVFSALQENVDQLMANLEDGLMLFTKDRRAVLVSASIESFLNKSRREMLGKAVHEIFSTETAIGRSVLVAFEQQHSFAAEDVTSESGRHLQASLDFIEENGERLGALLTLRDAESMREIEGEIELSRRLADVGRLTRGVGHEVKNPINAIVVHLELLRNKLHTADPTAVRHMDVIASEIRRLDRVVQTLVDFTRPIELRLSEQDLGDVVEEVMLLAAPDAEKQNVHMVYESAPIPLPVKADSDLLKQALLNIVINGAQAMPNGGTLTVRTRGFESEGQIEVSDQGSGIAPEVRDKVFNLYFTTKKNGNGIGLAMTYKVMQMHNGSVHFLSREGQGTTFYLNLPLMRVEQRSEADVNVPSPSMKVHATESQNT